MSKRAVITGIYGMDASTLAEYLLSLNYDVYGVYRRSSVGNIDTNIAHIRKHPMLHLIEGDIGDAAFVNKLVSELKPDEYYGLAAQTFVHQSFVAPLETMRINTEAVLIQLEAIKNFSPKTRFYNAASSEIYGGILCPETGYTELSPHYPRSPYGVSKSSALFLTRNYREAYGLFACSGILFNHSHPYGKRGHSFFTRKLTSSIAAIKSGKLDKMRAGDLSTFRDEGCSIDYTKGMHLMLQLEKPDDFIMSMGEGMTMREMLEYVCSLAELNPNDVYEMDAKFIRPSEVNRLLGNSSKFRALGWAPEWDLKSLLKGMYEHDLNIARGIA